MRGLATRAGGAGPPLMREGRRSNASSLKISRINVLNAKQLIVGFEELLIGLADIVFFAHEFDTPPPPQCLSDYFQKVRLSVIGVAITCGVRLHRAQKLKC